MFEFLLILHFNFGEKYFAYLVIRPPESKGNVSVVFAGCNETESGTLQIKYLTPASRLNFQKKGGAKENCENKCRAPGGTRHIKTARIVGAGKLIRAP